MTIKIDLLSFDEVLTKGAGFSKRHLLLGNGFSRALRNDIFSYDALFDRAEFSTLQNHGFSEKQKAFFDHSHLQLNRALRKAPPGMKRQFRRAAKCSLGLHEQSGYRQLRRDDLSTAAQ